MNCQNCGSPDRVNLRCSNHILVDDGSDSYDPRAVEIIRSLEAENATLRAEVERLTPAMRALESFTPSGSEFVGDVERCKAFIRERLSHSHRIAIDAVLARKKADELERLKGERDALQHENIKLESWAAEADFGFGGFLAIIAGIKADAKKRDFAAIIKRTSYILENYPKDSGKAYIE